MKYVHLNGQIETKLFIFVSKYYFETEQQPFWKSMSFTGLLVACSKYVSLNHSS